ncbi:MAG: DUF454 family protein [Aquabacterium sp.]|nr:MAG: DUF454 family protein [Aquabacterium sp.]
MKRPVYVALGVFFMVLGGVGAVLPVMPTVPFLLVAAACFARGHPPWEARMLAHPLYGPHILAWRRHGAIPLRAKQLATVMMCGSALFSGLLLQGWVRWVPTVIAVVVLPWIWSRPHGARVSAVAVTHLLYLHGFRSSPKSFKAQLLAQRAEELKQGGQDLTWWCPQLPPSPEEAVKLLREGLAGWKVEPERIGIVGSSLGGFYAGVLAEQLGCRAVLINPAVQPARDLARYIGEQASYHDPEERFFFREEFIEQFRTLAVPALSERERYMAIVAKGDEVLDWREMAQWCEGTQLKLLEGGDHALSDFETAHLRDVLAFLGLKTAP